MHLPGADLRRHQPRPLEHPDRETAEPDVSSIKELIRRWFPKIYFNSPAKHGGHRALADIRESIEELKFYRQAVFVAPPGPDAETVKALAAQFGQLPVPETQA